MPMASPRGKRSDSTTRSLFLYSSSSFSFLLQQGFHHGARDCSAMFPSHSRTLAEENMSKPQLDLDSRFLGDSSSFFSHLLSGEMIHFQLLFRQIVRRELSAASLRSIVDKHYRECHGTRWTSARRSWTSSRSFPFRLPWYYNDRTQ